MWRALLMSWLLAGLAGGVMAEERGEGRHERGEEAEGVWENPILSGPQLDAGPDDRYRVRYEPITFGRATRAPLPGLALAYEMTDWDGDGRTDVVALLRRGGGLVLYRNIGEEGGGGPRFGAEHRGVRLMSPGAGVRWFTLMDLDGEGLPEVLMYTEANDTGLTGGAGTALTAFYAEGDDPMKPQWRAVGVRMQGAREGEGAGAVGAFDFGGRLGAGDLDGDGREDLIIATFDEDDAIVGELPMKGRKRLSNFPPPEQMKPMTGRLWWSRNVTREGGEPTFAEPEELTADDRAIRVYTLGYPTVADLDGDGDGDVILGSQKPGLRVFLNEGGEGDGEGGEGEVKLREVGLLSDERGEPILSALAWRVAAGQMDGDPEPELVASSYFGNQGRYVLYDRVDGAEEAWRGWREVGPLEIEATADTPVYGMGNSTIDPVDFDGDGDLDLLLGGEPGLPTVAMNVGRDEATGRRTFAPPVRLRYVDGERIETHSIEVAPSVGSYWGPAEWYSDRLAPRAADWDGDGVLDLISGSMARRLLLFKGREVEGELRFERPTSFRHKGKVLDLPDRLFPAVLDWTGDGELDVLVSDDAGRVLLYPGDGTLDLGTPITMRHADGKPIILEDFWERKKGNRSGFAVADWDGDGLRDLVIYQFHRGVFLFRQVDRHPEAGHEEPGPAEARFEGERLLVPLYSHLAGPSVMDWDGDGELDLLIGGDERRMIEPRHAAHLVVFHGRDVLVPPGAAGG